MNISKVILEKTEKNAKNSQLYQLWAKISRLTDFCLGMRFAALHFKYSLLGILYYADKHESKMSEFSPLGSLRVPASA